MTHEAELRAWAKGLYTTEAATELLLRGFSGRFAAPGNPWVHTSAHSAWIDFAAIPDAAAGYSGGEQRFLKIAASLAEDVPVVLGDVVPGLDRDILALVLAAIAHAGGSHEHSDVSVHADGTATLTRVPTLYPWPET